MATGKNKISKTDTTSSMRDRFPMNISQTLFDTWQQLRRKGDPAKLQKELGFSRPTIDRAINYGNVRTDSTADKISKFFSKRLESEKAEGGSVKMGRESKKLLEKVNS